MIEVRKLRNKGKEFTYNLINNELVSRTCSQCMEIKDVEFFYKSEKRYLGYYPVCKLCQSDMEKKRYSENPEPYHVRSRNYYEKNSDKVKAQSKKWRQDNPEKYNDYRYVRDRDKRQRSLTNEYFLQLMDKHQECRELSEKTNQNYTVDHIIPLKGRGVSGLHVPWNVQFLTKQENSRKSNKWDGTYDNESWRGAYE